MDLLSLCPYPAAPLVWQLTPSRWVLTVVCKATYALVPGIVSAASEQEPIHDEDAHWDDDPGRSLFAPADLVPFKQRADVMLVGCAYARNGQPARSLVVRLNVGKIDKSIEVLCPRVRTRDGELREGKRWTKMPLLYERAAGGRNTDNPVGIHSDGVRDPYGQLALPNLQAPGLALPPDRLPPPIGFGPIAPDWPGRRGRVPRGGGDRDWARAPYGEGFDPLYFQAAPPDQQLDALRPTERIALENLLAKHPVFVSALPGDRVRARVELRGASPREINLVPDSLWIDTDRALCTVTFRAKVDIEHPDQEGRILVALAKSDQPIAWARIAPAPPPPSSQTSQSAQGSQTSPSSPPPGASAPNSPSPPPAGRAAPPPGSAAPAPSVAPSGPPAARVSSPPAPTMPPPVPAARPSAAPAKVPPAPRRDDPPRPPPEPPPPPPPALRMEAPARVELTPPVDVDGDNVESVEVTMTEALGGGLDQTAALRPLTALPQILAADHAALPFQPAPPGYKPPAALPSRPGFAPSTPHDLTVTPSFGLPPVRPTLPDWDVPSPAPEARKSTPPVPPPPLVSSPAWSALTPSRVAPPPPPPLLGAPPKDAPLGALEASNAAAGASANASAGDSASPRDTRQSSPQDAEPAPAAPAVVVELLWFDPTAPLRFAQHPLFAAAKRPVPAPEPSNADDLARALVYDALTRSAPTGLGALESVLDAAEEESPPAAALAVVAGTLELCLDEVEMLRAVAAAAGPLAASDKKLKEAIDLATEMLKSPMQGMPDFAEGLAARIRDAWTKANRALPPEHLVTSTERLLLEQRAYQRRELLDDTWIRGLLSADGSGPLPVYVPARIAKRLPLFRRFPARLLAEIVWPQDQYETASLALRTLALGRLPARPRPGSAKGRRRGG